MKQKVIKLIRELQAISQNGLLFAETPFHKERYEKVLTIATELFSINSNIPVKELKNIFLEQKGYATPKLDTRAVIVENNKILFVREKDDQKWSLPGGWVEVGETPKMNIIKEVFEECGINIEVKKLLGVYDKDLHDKEPTSIFQVFSFFFYCEILKSDFKLIKGSEIDAIGFFQKDKLPPLSNLRINKWEIERVLELLKTPNVKTDFD
ncbi:MAG: hypothetical protein COB12_04785 [Flavobacterium sp.]|nr:MAG: hypothetical protein COB12_04785 [Flavobacterium sp.]